MNDRERIEAVRKVRYVYGALIAAAIYQCIESLRDVQECMLAASKISEGGY